ncbi:uncharacterized protein Triagg1_2205 [Trichoderma aggressivum f. europaeum]|uniref:Heterokaryon incompatibility domain-containing protein n=1 Tax=Trichoderma aggressivum f. europaeum TaxID=173218 RepID=A0AAE1IHN5_9HYPO|nr:hypothetical protein Triagg1_2205 [Trichoderma aggressivum f. europaeum]
MEEFKYTPLNLERPAIRLLSLHPGNDDMMISCELFQAEFHQRENMLPYEALSYTWGSSELSDIIHVNGCHLGITHNLYSALVDLRYQDRQRVLWIDAVCIDQKNDKERGHQVGQMGNIYEEADRVIFRLGSGTNETDLFMESLQRLQKESIRHACRAWSRQDGRWKDLWYSFRPILEEYDDELANLQQEGLREILQRPWFRRVWILQEVAFAKAGTLSCGTKSVSVSLFGLTPLLLGITPDAHCQSVFDIMPSPWRKSTWWSESRSLYRLLLKFGSSEATDPRDLVYALRGISSDLAGKCDDPLFPDYEKPLEKLIYDVIQHIYEFDVTYILKEAPRLSSIREVVSNFPRLETDICRYLAEMSLPDHMERILNKYKIPVSQDMIKVAALYDKEGKVVNVLLRCSGGQLKIDDEVLLCAAANLNGAKEVFEAFWYHQNQLIITEEILIATAKNLGSGHSAMCFLLSLKTQVYRIAPISEAITWNTPASSREEIIRMLLLQKDYRNDTIPEVLTAASEIQDYKLQKEIITTLLQQKDYRNTTIPDVLTAAAKIQNHELQREIITTLLQQKDYRNDAIPEVLTAASKIQDYNLQKEVITTLLQQKDCRTTTIPDVFTATAKIQHQDLQKLIITTLLQQKGSSNNIISEVITAAINNRDFALKTLIMKTLLEQKGSSNNIISEAITTAVNIRDFDLQVEILKMLLQRTEFMAAAAEVQGFNLQTKIKAITATDGIQDSDLQIKIIKVPIKQKGNNANILLEAITTAAKIQDFSLKNKTIKSLLKQKGNSPDVISEFITAAGKTQDPFIKREIIENLLKQKSNSNDTISKGLTIATNIQPFGLMMIKDFVRKNPGFEISRDAVIVAMKNWPGNTDSLQVLCRYFPSLNPGRKQIG